MARSSKPLVIYPRDWTRDRFIDAGLNVRMEGGDGAWSMCDDGRGTFTLIVVGSVVGDVCGWMYWDCGWLVMALIRLLAFARLDEGRIELLICWVASESKVKVSIGVGSCWSIIFSVSIARSSLTFALFLWRLSVQTVCTDRSRFPHHVWNNVSRQLGSHPLPKNDQSR